MSKSTTISLVAPLTIDYGKITTVRSAERAIMRASIDLRWYGMEHPDANQWADNLEALLVAIMVTTGETGLTILDRMRPNIDRAYDRQEKASMAQAKRLGLI